MLNRFLIPALCALALNAPALTAPAAAGSNLASDIAGFEILPGWTTAAGTRMTALRIRLAPGWKTYWRAPGEAGIPPRFDWTGSRNIAAVTFHWPVPEVFDQNGMRSLGYRRELVLPIELTPRAPGDMALRAEVEIGVCEDICVPMQARISADLSGSGAPDAAISRAMASRPDTAAEAGLRAIACSVEPIADGLRVTARIEMPRMAAGEVAVFEMRDQGIWISQAETSRSGGVLTTVAEMVPPSGQPFAFQRSDVLITVLAGGRAVEIEGCAG